MNLKRNSIAAKEAGLEEEQTVRWRESYREQVIKGERKKSFYKFWRQKTNGKLMQVKKQDLTSAISGVDSALLT